jgi:hypothetical protein
MTERYSHNTGDYECKLCDKKYARKFTLERHLVGIHGFSWEEYLRAISENVDGNSINNPSNSINNPDNGNQNPSNGNNPDNSINVFKCNDCKKTFTRNWSLKKHKEICKGLQTTVCEYCKKKLSCMKSKKRHLKICKIKKEYDKKKEEENNSNNEVNETTNSTIYTSCDDNIPKKGIVYFIQPHELVGTDRYKIGCSSNNSLERLKAYRKGTRIILVYDCYNPFDIEKIIKLEFNKSFTLISGTEIFRGNESDMKLAFINILLDIK